MSDHRLAYRPLPCREDRQKLIEQAVLVLAEARAIKEQWDQIFARLSAERLAEFAKAVPPHLCGSGAGMGALAKITLESL
jgi:hypothetical protein